MSKDPNYVVKVEKAIAEKYGKDTVQNPRSLWTVEKEEKYLEEMSQILENNETKSKNEKVEVDGVLFPKKLLNKETNRSCPVCGIYSFESRDDIYMNKYQCCHTCYIQYVEGREERWLKGWRPEQPSQPTKQGAQK